MILGLAATKTSVGGIIGNEDSPPENCQASGYIENECGTSSDIELDGLQILHQPGAQSSTRTEPFSNLAGIALNIEESIG